MTSTDVKTTRIQKHHKGKNMNPLGIGIALGLFALKMMSSKEVIERTKMLVKAIDNRTDITGQQKTDHVVSELSRYFRDMVPIILEMVVKMAVLDMQNKNGVLQTKLNNLGKDEKH